VEWDPVLSGLQALPAFENKGIRPVTDRVWQNEHEAWTVVVNDIGRLVTEYRQQAEAQKQQKEQAQQQAAAQALAQQEAEAAARLRQQQQAEAKQREAEAAALKQAQERLEQEETARRLADTQAQQARIEAARDERAAAQQRLHDGDYTDAANADTIAAYETFLQKHPDSPHLREVRARIKSLRQEKSTPLPSWRFVAIGVGILLLAWAVWWFVGGKDSTPSGETTPATEITDPAELFMVLVKGGTFQMGCTSEQEDCDEDREKPVHSVTLNDYYIGKYEVTQKHWRDIMGTEPSYFKNCDHCPVEQVSWEDVQVFLKKLNAKYPGFNYRLPTEAEWEYAARERGKAVLFGNGKNILDPKEANFNASAEYKKPYTVAGEYRGKTTPVGAFPPNALGLYDMAGNVWEWCSDWYDTYPSNAQTNPTGPSSGSYRVLRGGSWGNDPRYARVAYRSFGWPVWRSHTGFRLARTK
jgi:formylglycine-generating enzyme required for sulfatase activity